MRTQRLRASAAPALALLTAAASVLAGCMGTEFPDTDPSVSLTYTVTPTDDSVTYRVTLPLLLRANATHPLVANLSLAAGTAAWTIQSSARGEALVIEGRGPIRVAAGLTLGASQPFRHDTTLTWTLERTTLPVYPYYENRARESFAQAGPPLSMNITASFDEGGGACFTYDRIAGTLQANSTWQAFYVDAESLCA